MADDKQTRAAKLRALNKSLYEVEGADRLKRWMDITVLALEDGDPENHVSGSWTRAAVS